MNKVRIINKNLLTYLLKRLRTAPPPVGHTSQIIYNREDWKKFRHILDYEGTNPNRVFWAVLETILEQYDIKEHSLEKYLDECELVKPTIGVEREKLLKYFQTCSIEKMKEYEEFFMIGHLYCKAITRGDTDVYIPNLYRKYG